MAKFIYRMQNILNIKYKLEEQAKTAYSNANKAYEIEKEKLKKLFDIKDSYEQDLRELMASTLNIQKIRQMESAIDNITDKIEVQKKEVIKAYKRLNAARQQLKENVIERKTHEKLRDNAFEEFVKEVNAAQMKEIDEIVSYRFNHSK